MVLADGLSTCHARGYNLGPARPATPRGWEGDADADDQVRSGYRSIYPNRGAQGGITEKVQATGMITVNLLSNRARL